MYTCGLRPGEMKLLWEIEGEYFEVPRDNPISGADANTV